MTELPLPPPKKNMTIKQFISKNFIAGLSVLVPIYFTYYILEAIIVTFDKIIDILPKELQPKLPNFPGFGLLLAFTIALLVGMLVRNYFGKLIIDFFQRLVSKIPLIATLYGLLRQISEAFLGDEKKSFNRVVLVEWPRKDAWTLAFVTGELGGMLATTLGKKAKSAKFLNLFIPTTPNPTSGFYFMVAEEEAIDLDISVDQAFKTIISAGSIPPDHPKIVARKK